LINEDAVARRQKLKAAANQMSAGIRKPSVAVSKCTSAFFQCMNNHVKFCRCLGVGDITGERPQLLRFGA